jgi:hypothetical protein
MIMNSSEKQKIREEVLKALGQACKSPHVHVATDAFQELKAVLEKVFEK